MHSAKLEQGGTAAGRPVADKVDNPSRSSLPPSSTSGSQTKPLSLERRSISLAAIVVLDRYEFNEHTVSDLMTSIQRLGLQTPITVRQSAGEMFTLIAGRNRLEACRRLDMALIQCAIFDGDETDARLWQISENLHRKNLRRLEKAELIADWIRLTAEKVISAQVAPKGPVGHRPQGGINAAVRDLGIDRTEVRRSVQAPAWAAFSLSGAGSCPLPVLSSRFWRGGHKPLKTLASRTRFELVLPP